MIPVSSRQFEKLLKDGMIRQDKDGYCYLDYEKMGLLDPPKEDPPTIAPEERDS